jgi:hypothetical protein
LLFEIRLLFKHKREKLRTKNSINHPLLYCLIFARSDHEVNAFEIRTGAKYLFEYYFADEASGSREQDSLMGVEVGNVDGGLVK